MQWKEVSFCHRMWYNNNELSYAGKVVLLWRRRGFVQSQSIGMFEFDILVPEEIELS